MTDNFPKDGYKDEILPRLKTAKIFKRFEELCNPDADPAGSDALALVTKAIEYSYHRHKMVLTNMGEFTLHDSEHLFRLLTLMDLLIPEETLKALSTPELMLLILTVFFHDIGMAPSERIVQAWLGNLSDSSTPEEIEENKKFERFVTGKETRKREINDLRKEGRHVQADHIMKYLVSEYIRVTHAERAIEILKDDWDGKIVYRNINLTPQLAQLCRSHNEEATKLLELQHLMPAGLNTYICLPFIGIMLRLADVLDFDAKRTPAVLYEHLFINDPTSIMEWQKHRSVSSWHISGNFIGFSADCSHPAIESGIRKFCSYIDEELRSCSSILSNLHDSAFSPFPEYYKIQLPAKVDVSKVKPETDLKGKPNYLYRDTSFRISKDQIIDLLMGTKLYGQPHVALRELVQNSIDTCLLRKKLESTWGNHYTPEIIISFTTNGGATVLTITDNGVGMDQEIIDKFYSNIGVSYYKSADFMALKADVGVDYVPTSRFGIGVLSCFMVSDHISVQTRRVLDNHSYAEPLDIHIEGKESIFYIKPGSNSKPGTTTSLALRKDNPWAAMPVNLILDHVKQIIPFPPFQFKIVIEGTESLHSPVVLEAVSVKSFGISAAHKSLRTFEVNFDGSEGIFGVAEITLIEVGGKPVAEEISAKQKIKINDADFFYSETISLGSNTIKSLSTGPDFRSSSGNITSRTTQTHLRTSKSKLAFQGIQLTANLFDGWSGDVYQKSKVQWPLAVLLNINIGSPKDLNLNSARTEIIFDEKWQDFELTLSALILKGIKDQVSAEYWSQLKTVFEKVGDKHSKNFMQALADLS